MLGILDLMVHTHVPFGYHETAGSPAVTDWDSALDSLVDLTTVVAVILNHTFRIPRVSSGSPLRLFLRPRGLLLRPTANAVEHLWEFIPRTLVTELPPRRFHKDGDLIPILGSLGLSRLYDGSSLLHVRILFVQERHNARELFFGGFSLERVFGQADHIHRDVVRGRSLFYHEPKQIPVRDDTLDLIKVRNHRVLRVTPFHVLENLVQGILD